MNAKLQELQERKKYLASRCQMQRETIALHWETLNDSLRWISWVTNAAHLIRRHPIFASAATGIAFGMQGTQLPNVFQKAVGVFQTAKKLWGWWKNRS